MALVWKKLLYDEVSATSKILGRKSSGAGAIEECSLSEILDFIGSATQGDMLVRGASSWERYAKPTYIEKASDETVNNSNTYQDDNDFTSISLLANIKYEIECMFYVLANSTSKFKIKFVTDQNCDFRYQVFSNTTTAGGIRWTQSTDLATISSTILSGNPQMNVGNMHILGNILVGGSNASLKIQWAQETAEVFDTKILTGSWLKITKRIV